MILTVRWITSTAAMSPLAKAVNPLNTLGRTGYLAGKLKVKVPAGTCINGQWVTIKAGFLDFPDLQTCVAYLVDRWYRDYQRYKGVNRAGSPEECARLLVTEGYATDPQYAEKLIRIMKENG
jgi:flagellum-specific peptidoglycan hydrolase FlgJ